MCVLVRDVTDLRRRDRLLLSKDATIREIHHRVKNNLQTIAALLRLQGRRLQSPEAQEAIEESERRIRSIAIVHETLSREPGDEVRFDDIVQPLVRVVAETVTGPDRDLRLAVEGDAGMLPGDLATPLAVVLNELMQNAVDHAFVEATARPAGTSRWSWPAPTVSWWSTWSTTAWVCRPASPSSSRAGSGCRSCTRWSPASWVAPSSSAAITEPACTSPCRCKTDGDDPLTLPSGSVGAS